MNIYNSDCITDNNLIDKSIDLMICDPPFGIGENDFDKYYKRSNRTVTTKYEQAPDNYEEWTYNWLSIAKNKLKDNGTIYVISGWSNLREVLNAIHKCDLYMVNHNIWKFNFGVYTKKRYVTSHYHVLMLTKGEKVKYTFNQYCRYGPQEKNETGGSSAYKDMEDVFIINRDMRQEKEGVIKNNNKLASELIDKLILYSSNKDDQVCDFFMGNFTTAYSSIKLGRKISGFEINKELYDFNMKKLKELKFGYGLDSLKKVDIKKPKNQGKKITEEEKTNIKNDYDKLLSEGKLKKNISSILQEKYGRGPFSIKNILDSLK